tara:strand:- start:378 stop:968 length:591 start_codon:yes stop_codon:yes gene_type:complete
METIPLNTIKTYVISLPKDLDRLSVAKKNLLQINQPHEVVDGVEHEQGVVGCGLAHFSLFNSAKPRCLILEDDIALTDNILQDIEIPEGADAIYLGISNHAYVRRRNVGIMDAVMCSRWDKNYKRVLNMCSTHAIIYLSDRYWQAARLTIAQCLQTGVAFDLGLASIHRHFNILTPNDPMFFQTEQPHNTNLSLEV